MRTPVTAGDGSIGSSDVRRLPGKGHEAVVLSDISSGLLLTDSRLAVDEVGKTAEPLL